MTNSLAKACRNRVEEVWLAIPVLCSHCGHPIGTDAVNRQERVGWCPHCKQVFRVPFLKVPGWIVGTMLVLIIKLQAVI